MLDSYWCSVTSISGRVFSASFWSTTFSWMVNVTISRVSRAAELYRLTQHVELNATWRLSSRFVDRDSSGCGLPHPFGPVLLRPVTTLLLIHSSKKKKPPPAIKLNASFFFFFTSSIGQTFVLEELEWVLKGNCRPLRHHIIK